MGEKVKSTFDRKMEFFFQDPNIYLEVNKSSILHLLRRDVYSCMGYTKVNDKDHKLIKDDNINPIIWPGAMAVLAGIDLLSKFYAGSDNQGHVGSRFKTYCEKYIDSDNAEVIYQLRNSLLHSFGLFSKTKTATYYFQVSSCRSELVTLLPNIRPNYNIDLCTLWDKFEQSIEKYKEDIEKDDSLKKNFLKMFDLYC